MGIDLDALVRVPDCSMPCENLVYAAECDEGVVVDPCVEIENAKEQAGSKDV